MKHFLVSDDVGTPIYFDHPDGRMLTLPIATMQDVMGANFSDSFTSMICGKTLFVFQKVSNTVVDIIYFTHIGQFDQLCFTIISDQGESESFLRSQLRLLHDVLMMVFSSQQMNGT